MIGEVERLSARNLSVRRFKRAGAVIVWRVAAAKWGLSSFYIATIASIDAGGRYLVNYGDGDRSAVGVGMSSR